MSLRFSHLPKPFLFLLFTIPACLQTNTTTNDRGILSSEEESSSSSSSLSLSSSSSSSTTSSSSSSSSLSSSSNSSIASGEGCACGSRDPAKPCRSNKVEIPYGDPAANKKVIFEFTEELRCGEFASSGRHGNINGSRFWVAPPVNGGKVTLLKSHPLVKGSGNSLRNGMMTEYSHMNPGLHFTGGKRGFGSNYAFHNLQSINTAELSPNNIGVGAQTILKAVSHPIYAEIADSKDPGLKCDNSARNCEEFIAPLVIVSRPPGDVFAPPYFGPDKVMIPRSAFRASFIPNLAPGPALVPYISAHASLAHIRATEGLYDLNTRESHGGQVNTASRGYEGYRNTQLWGSILRMMIRPESTEEARMKEEMGLFVVQHAIDLYAIHRHGRGTSAGSPNPSCGAWIGNGGFGYSRLGLIVIGLSLIEKQDWLSELNSVLGTKTGTHCFGESTMIQPANLAGRKVPLFGSLSTSAYGIGATNKTAGDPTGWVDGGGNTSAGLTYKSADVITANVGPYHSCCIMGTFIGQALAVRSIAKAYEAWPSNFRHYFQFVDRSYRGEDNKAYAYLDSRTTALSAFNIGGYMPQGMAEYWTTYNTCLKNGTCSGQ